MITEIDVLDPIEIEDAPTGALPTYPLSVQLTAYAQGYIDARKRAGEAWLSMGMFLSMARDRAKHGEWQVFLKTTQTSEDQAKRLIAIYVQSEHDRAFAKAMHTNFLSVATGYELISAPPDVQDRLLNGDTPPTQRQIRDEKRAAAKSAAPPTLDAVAEIGGAFWQAMSPNHPTAHLWTRTGMNEHHAACGMVTQRAPSGSTTDRGHCVKCTQATWPQSQGEGVSTQPTRPEVAPAHMACPTCGEIILNGIWGDLKECGSCYHPRQRAAVAQIRAEASAIGLGVIWEDDTVILHWPEEEIDQLLGMSYADALDWLAGEGAQQAEARKAVPTSVPTLESLDATLPLDLLKAGYFWHSADPIVIAHNDGWRGDAPTVSGALALAADREKQRSQMQLAISQAQYMIELLYAGNWNGATSAYTTLGRMMGIEV